MKKLLGKSLELFLKARSPIVKNWVNNPTTAQREVFEFILRQSLGTAFGYDHKLSEVRDMDDFKAKVPVREYEDLFPYIERMLTGERNVLWPGMIEFFAKSSGTTNDSSKYLPVSKYSMKENLNKGSWDTMTMLYKNNEDPGILRYKSLILGGNLDTITPDKGIHAGDISAIMLHHMPTVSKPFYTPDVDTATIENWEEKLNKVADKVSVDDQVGMISGVPTWNLVLFRMILERTGKSSMSEIWPNFRAYIHGGVSFSPYIDEFNRFFPDRKLIYQEVYNASEGYIGIQLHPEIEGMILLTDHGILYEFIPMSDFYTDSRETISLSEVKANEEYAIVITTTSGLYRYLIGDVIEFLSVHPFTFKIKGRTKSYINAFGEELMVHNTETALTHACRKHNCFVSDYTVAPKYAKHKTKGRHDWVIEFLNPPSNLAAFARDLDRELQKINSDYAAKRTGSFAMEELKLFSVDKGTFYAWMQDSRRISAQTKVPRLSNHRKIIDDLLRHATAQRSFTE